MKELLIGLTIIVSVISPYNLFGQNQSVNMNRNTLFIELGGNAPLISLNYDHIIPTKNGKFKYSLTFGTTHHFTKPLDFVLAPQLNTLLGRSLMAEIGVGFTIPVLFTEDWVWVPRLGGRYQNMSGGMFYRLAFTPTFSPYNQQLFFPMFGVSIGYTFKGS